MTDKQRDILLALGVDLKTAIEEQANEIHTVRIAMEALEANRHIVLSLEAKLTMCLAAVTQEKEPMGHRDSSKGDLR